jgi:3-oxoacyl-[acyl-carrier-protein] synthase III
MTPPSKTVEADTIERLINQRTGGRIHRLQVELKDSQLVVRGRTTSYYVKQLALQAALDALDSTNVNSVELDIYVGDGRPNRRTHL